MKDVLERIRSFSLREENLTSLYKNVNEWLKEIKTVEYKCLGCNYCYPAVAIEMFYSNIFINKNRWPFVAGDYFAFCEGTGCPVAVSTLASVELANKLAKIKPEGLCIVGKTETENIGVEKVVRNIITNPTIKYLLLVGKDPEGHWSGRTIISLWKNGVDDDMKVKGSPGKRPVLKNLTVKDIEAFRKQVLVVDMIGEERIDRIVDKIKELSKRVYECCGDRTCLHMGEVSDAQEIPVISAKSVVKPKMDKAGYFVIIPQPDRKIITVEHYSYDNKLLRVIEGEDAKSIYMTIINNGWVTELSHAAYLGAELKKAELSLKLGFKYIQDGA